MLILSSQLYHATGLPVSHYKPSNRPGGLVLEQTFEKAGDNCRYGYIMGICSCEFCGICYNQDAGNSTAESGFPLRFSHCLRMLRRFVWQEETPLSDARERIMKALNDGTAIPAGPMVMSRIAQLCRDTEATARDLAKVIQLDGTLATKVLRQVNSSFYGLTAQVKTVTHAVVILGFQEVKHIALTVPIAQLFHTGRHSHGINISELWDSTLTTSCLARALSYHIQHPVPEQVFVSAILAKTGMIVLNTIIGDEYADVMNYIIDIERLPFVEKERLGISHVQLGWMLAKKWQFPDELLDAIAYQYNPAPKGELKREAGLIFVARRLYNSIHSQIPIRDTLLRMPPSVITGFKLNEDVAQKALERAGNEFEEVRQMLASS